MHTAPALAGVRRIPRSLIVFGGSVEGSIPAASPDGTRGSVERSFVDFMNGFL